MANAKVSGRLNVSTWKCLFIRDYKKVFVQGTWSVFPNMFIKVTLFLVLLKAECHLAVFVALSENFRPAWNRKVLGLVEVVCLLTVKASAVWVEETCCRDLPKNAEIFGV